MTATSLPRHRRWLTLAVAVGSSACTAAQQWTFLDGPAYGGRMATFDWARGRLVSLGLDGATWEFANGQLLNRAVTGTSPPPRYRGVMAYDLARRRVLLFGGIDGNNTAIADTWVWDGATWTQLQGLQPAARGDAGSVYDIVRDRVVLYGGYAPFVSQFSDTWEHDGSRWIQRQPATLPGVNSPTMAYDLNRGVTVMVVNSGSVNAPVDTWEWDGVDWTLRATTGPSVRSNASMAYDLPRGRTVMCGGIGTGNAFWEWDGVAWQQIAVPNAPARLNPAVHFDPTLGGIGIVGGWDFLLSGSTVMQGSARTDAWKWNGSALAQVHGDLRPSSRYGHTWVADEARGELVLFGGLRQQAPVDETWTWDGSTWSERHPVSSPSPRVDAAGTFDASINTVLLFGGFVSGSQLNDLWSWDGSNWSLLDNGSGPSPRGSAGLAYDTARGAAVLFGGSGGPLHQPASLRNDTWEWIGLGWTRRVTATAPSPREGAAMAFDPGRNVTVLFGGRTGATAGNQLADTWEWDGVQWRAIATATSPPPLLEPSLNHDQASASVLLAGTLVSGQTFDNQLWRYRNGNWSWVFSDANPQLGGDVVMDPRRQRLVSNKGTVIAEWTTTPAAVTSIGAACGAPAPVLHARARPRIGEAGFGLEARTESIQPVLFALATAQGNFPIGNGCTIWIRGSMFSVVVPANFAGVSDLPIPIPASGSLRGVVLYAQAVTPGVGGVGLRWSQGLRLQLGD